MPLARIITSTPALAKDVARALRGSGYIVDIVSPQNIPDTAVDLEIDLDLQNGVAWQPADLPSSAPVAASQTDEFDAESDYEHAVEREFILAPAWRKLTSQLRDTWDSLRPQPGERDEVSLHLHNDDEEPERPQHPETVFPVREPSAQPQHQTASIIEMPTSPAKRGTRIFAASISRTQKQLSAKLTEALALLSKAMESLRSSAALRNSQAKAQLAQLLISFSAWLQRPASERRAQNSARLKPARDRYIVRQLWPVAAGMALAFLVGWAAVTFNNPQEQQIVRPASSVSSASITTMKRNSPAARARQQRIHAATVAQKPSALRRVSSSSEEADLAQDEDEVVIRHYPAKAVTAKSQTQGFKRYSDIN